MKFKNDDLIIILMILNPILSQYIYLGVERYGEIKREEVLNKDNQIYRFLFENKKSNLKYIPVILSHLKKLPIMTNTNAKKEHFQSKIN